LHAVKVYVQVNCFLQEKISCYISLISAFPYIYRGEFTWISSQSHFLGFFEIVFHANCLVDLYVLNKQTKESVDAAIGDVLSKPWLPLPLGLKPPSLDGVLGELQRQGIRKIPPSHAWKGSSLTSIEATKTLNSTTFLALEHASNCQVFFFFFPSFFP